MEQNSCVGLSGGASTSSSANATTPKIGSGHPKRPLRSQVCENCTPNKIRVKDAALPVFTKWVDIYARRSYVRKNAVKCQQK